MNLKFVYTGLLEDHSSHLEPVLQRRILQHARRHDDTELLCALTARPELVADVDTAIGASTELSVLVPWMLRPGRDPEHLVERLGREKRVTVLQALAGTVGLPPAVYAALAEHPSSKVLRAVITGQGADKDAKRLALRTFSERPPRDTYWATSTERLRELIDGSGQATDAWNEIGMHAFALPYLLAAFAYGSATAAHVQRWSADLEAIHEYDGGRWREKTADLVLILAAHSLTREQYERIDTAVRSILLEAEDLTEYWVRLLLEAQKVLRAYDVDVEERIRRLAAETDTTEAVRALKEVRQTCSPSQLHRLLAEAVANPCVPVEEIFALRDDLNLASMRRFVTRLAAEDRTDILVEWLADHQDAAHIPAFITQLPDPHAVIELYLDAESAQGRLWPTWSVETRHLRRRPELAIAHLPWSVLAVHSQSVPGLNTVISRRLTETLGDEDALWETFETLGADFDGALNDLLFAVTELGS